MERIHKDVWNKLFFRIMAAYPSWKPDAAVNGLWYDELGSYPPQVIWAAVKSLSIVSGGEFPPSLFQILAEVRKLADPDESIDQIWEDLRRQSASGAPDLSKFSDRVLKALRAIGGIRRMGSANIDTELPWIKKDFIRIYNDFQEIEARSDVKSQHKIESGKVKELISGIANRIGSASLPPKSNGA